MSLKLKKDIWLHWGETADRPFPLEIFQCAYIHLTDWTSSRSFGNFWHLYWNSRSGASVKFEGKNYPFSSRNVYLIPAHTLFSARLTRPVDHFYIDFTLGSEKYFQTMKRHIYTLPVDYMKQMLPSFLNNDDFLIRKTVLQALIWHYLALIRKEDFQDQGEKQLDVRIARAIELMEKELGTIQNVSEICRRVGMSSNSFYLLFKKETNKTPQMFLTQLRMGKASYLLEHTEEAIDEIALQTGFADRYHFSKRYKQLTGRTPVGFRYWKKKGLPAAQLPMIQQYHPSEHHKE